MDESADQSNTADANGNCDSPGSSSSVPESNDALLFIRDDGEPMSFILSIRSHFDMQEYTKLIEDRLGTVKLLKDFGDYDVVLVHDKASAWSHGGDNFKISYIKDCIKQGELLNISDYRLNANSKFVDNFNYMNIIYKKKFTWNTVPNKYLKPRKGPSPVPMSIEDRLLADDDNDDDRSSVVSENSSRTGCIDKRTKSLFSASERRAMVEYIFKKKEFSQMKGNVFWKQMEAANVCPIRTWQSLKNHFAKTLVYELDAFNLKKADYVEFRKWYFRKNTDWKKGKRM